MEHEKLEIRTGRLTISEFSPEMAASVSEQSLDADNRRFLPDEVFETEEIAAEVIADLSELYGTTEGPLVYPILLNGRHIGHVEAVPLEQGGWEVGYHVGGAYVGNGYATEAVRAFVPAMMDRLGIDRMAGVCHAENVASCRVLEKAGFALTFEGEGQYQGQNARIRRYEFCKDPAERA